MTSLPGFGFVGVVAAEDAGSGGEPISPVVDHVSGLDINQAGGVAASVVCGEASKSAFWRCLRVGGVMKIGLGCADEAAIGLAFSGSSVSIWLAEVGAVAVAVATGLASSTTICSEGGLTQMGLHERVRLVGVCGLASITANKRKLRVYSLQRRLQFPQT